MTQLFAAFITFAMFAGLFELMRTWLHAVSGQGMHDDD